MASANPQVTIVIPCYRQGHLLASAIDSSLRQTYGNVEIIVVNDGSDDNTREVAQSYGARITYVEKLNGGLISARNAGIANASGDYFLFLDADDMLSRQSVSKLVEAMEQQDGRLAVMGWQELNDDQLGNIHAQPSNELNSALFRDNLGPPHAYLSSRRMVESLSGFDGALNGGCADWDFWLRQLFAGATLKAVSEVGAIYRVSSTSMSQNAVLMDADRAHVFRRVLKWIDAQPGRLAELGIDYHHLRQQFRKRSAREHATAAYGFRQKHQYLKAALHYLRAMLHGSVAEGLCGLVKLALHACAAIIGL